MSKEMTEDLRQQYAQDVDKVCDEHLKGVRVKFIVIYRPSVANTAVYPPNWATLKSPAAGQKTVGRVT